MEEVVKLAAGYLVEVWSNYSKNDEKLCSYGMALAACALAGDKSGVSAEILTQLKSRIQSGNGKYLSV